MTHRFSNINNNNPNKKMIKKGFTLTCMNCGSKMGPGNKAKFELTAKFRIFIEVDNKEVKFTVPQNNPVNIINNIDWTSGVICKNCGSENVKIDKFEKEM